MFEIINHNQSGIKILVVEDDRTSQQLIKIYLDQKFAVEIVNSGEEAIESAKKNLYDLILMDINLGQGKNGIQTSMEIRKLSEYISIPIVAMTAFEKSEIVDFFSSNGMDLYLEKPYLRHHLLEVIDKGLQQKILNPERRE
ncbi:MAG: response regulator [Ignavibacteriales bacterium]|nr:response regulator [Ignavibacteriales bacterium]MBK7378512.1 response regulator [Ignavibacteriales bacterium]